MLRHAARRLRLGELALRFVHRPLGLARLSIKEGGPREQRKTEAGRQAMIAAAARLPQLQDPANPYPLPFTFLSGARYWHQTLFCIVSAQQHLERRIDATVFDDGSFTEALRAQMLRTVPWIRFVGIDQAEADLEARLPASRFPALRNRRLEYPHLRKLTDLHCASDGWKLVLDSDMLFFRRPDAVLDWMAAPTRPIFMQDVASAYGYSDRLLRELAGARVPDRVNVGLYAFDGARIDWDRIEHWCAQQIAREGPCYLQEQALVAMMLAGTDAAALPDRDYVVLPSLAEGRAQRAVLHHYVAESKRSYYQHCWQGVAHRAGLDLPNLRTK